jgi:hypothetical protein
LEGTAVVVRNRRVVVRLAVPEDHAGHIDVLAVDPVVLTA